MIAEPPQDDPRESKPPQDGCVQGVLVLVACIVGFVLLGRASIWLDSHLLVLATFLIPIVVLGRYILVRPPFHSNERKAAIVMSNVGLSVALFLEMTGVVIGVLSLPGIKNREEARRQHSLDVVKP